MPDDDTQNNPRLKYKELFPPSSHLPSLAHFPSPAAVGIFHVVDGAIKAFERPYYYWLLSPLPKLETIPKTTEPLRVSPLSTLWILMNAPSRLDAVRHADEYRRYEALLTKLRATGFPVGLLNVLEYELAFFLKLIPFETAFEALRKHRQESRYTNVLVNTLGDSLLDGGEQIGQFYEQFETAIRAIGYSPEDLQTFEGVLSGEMAGAFRNIIGELISIKKYAPRQREFVKRMWRAACTLHLTATFRHVFGRGRRWEEEFAPIFYQAIDVGSIEVFDSGYEVYEGDEHIGGHNVLVEVQKTTDSSYHVRQFNSGSGIRSNHKKCEEGILSSVERYSSFVDMSALSEYQIKQSGYYHATSSTDEAAIEKLYKNKPPAQHPPTPTDPLLCERPQLAGTCTASSKMFYLRAFKFEGRMLEIDFKVELIKQLLDRINRVHINDVYRTALIRSMKAEERARFGGDTALEAAISKERKGLLKTLKMEESDQYIVMFPNMFISLIASALNDILHSLYWIIENDKPDMARHFLSIS